MKLEPQHLNNLTLLRAAVGALGERAAPAWWRTSFCDENGSVFLAPVFPRTHIHARCRGVVAAAALAHDERIGVGEVFHLFRLPEYAEQALWRLTLEAERHDEVIRVMEDDDAALRYLRETAGKAQKSADGPIMLGSVRDWRAAELWRNAAAFYADAFERQVQVFPYLTARA